MRSAVAAGCALWLTMCGGSGAAVNTTPVAAGALADVQCKASAGDASKEGLCFESSPEDPAITLVRVRAPTVDRCIRVVQDGDGQLGYASVHDRPNRKELEVALHGGQAAFVLDVSPVSLVVGKRYGDVDGTLSIDFFALSCGALCDHQAGDDRLVFDRDGAHVGTVRSGTRAQCPFLSEMPSVWGQDGGADAPP